MVKRLKATHREKLIFSSVSLRIGNKTVYLYISVDLETGKYKTNLKVTKWLSILKQFSISYDLLIFEIFIVQMKIFRRSRKINC